MARKKARILTGDFDQFSPLAWVVRGAEGDTKMAVLATREEAEIVAREMATRADQASWPIYPLYAGEPELIGGE
jgi:hypothetical protein